MKMSDKVKLAASAVMLGAAVGVATAKPAGPGNPTPGWEYGRINCGPFGPGNPAGNYKGCLDCCLKQYRDSPTFTAADLFDCQLYCDWIFNIPGTVVTMP